MLVRDEGGRLAELSAVLHDEKRPRQLRARWQLARQLVVLGAHVHHVLAALRTDHHLRAQSAEVRAANRAASPGSRQRRMTQKRDQKRAYILVPPSRGHSAVCSGDSVALQPVTSVTEGSASAGRQQKSRECMATGGCTGNQVVAHAEQVRRGRNNHRNMPASGGGQPARDLRVRLQNGDAQTLLVVDGDSRARAKVDALDGEQHGRAVLRARRRAVSRAFSRQSRIRRAAMSRTSTRQRRLAADNTSRCAAYHPVIFVMEGACGYLNSS